MNQRQIDKQTSEVELRIKEAQLRNEQNVEKQFALDKLTELRLALSEVTIDQSKEQLLGGEPFLKRVFTPLEIGKIKVKYFQLLNEI